MKNSALVAGLVLCMVLAANIVAGRSDAANNMEKLDNSLAVKINELGDETIKVIVWVDENKYDKYKAYGLGEVKKEFDIIPALAMDVKKSGLKGLASADFVKKITIDHPVKAFRSDAIPLLRAGLAMNTFGGNGTNIKIAVIDTGVFNHTEFQTPNRIILQKCFTLNACPPNNAASGNNATDDHGHGTHVAGIAAGEGGSFGRGAAPNVTIMAIKVLDSGGSGLESDVVSGIQWAVDNGANIISMSLGTTFDQFTDCYEVTTSAAVDNATSRGVVVIVAAGNSGSSARTIAAPACAKTAIAVGNTDKTDKIVSLSSRGPTNDNRTKPDLSATGTGITSTYPSYLGSNYFPASGTSMAAPFVSGIAATMMQKYNDSFGYLPSPGLVKAILLNSVNISNMTVDGFTQRNNNYGAGRIDAYDVLNDLYNAQNSSVAQNVQNVHKIFVSAISLKVTLVWMENSTTINNLDLIIGNSTQNYTNPSDVNDTVEQIFLSGIVNGTWNIYINGTSVTGTQRYFVAYSAAQVFPVFSNNATGKNSNVQYAPRENYSFEIKVNGSLSVDQVSHVIFQLNDTNYTKSSVYQIYNNSAGLFWINITDLSASVYSYRWLSNSSQNNWNSTSALTFIVAKNYSRSVMNLTLNNTNNDISSPYDYTVNITGWKNFTEGNLTLYRNGSVIGTEGIDQPNESVVLAGGIYNYTLFFTESQNYSFVNITRILTITKRPSSTALLLNGSSENFVYNFSTFANFTATVNISGKNLTLTSNMSGWIDQNGTNRINNETLLKQNGIFNITSYFAGDDNYSSSSQTLFATVRDVHAPLIVSNSTYPGSGIEYFPGRTYKFNVTLQDEDSASFVIMQFNSTNHTAYLHSGSASSRNWSINITDLAANSTGYPVVWYANDTSGNWNKTNVWHYVIQKNSSLYTSLIPNATTTELGEYFSLNSSSPVDTGVETRIYSNVSLENLTLRNFSAGTNRFVNVSSSAGVFNFSANASGNENYTANATLEYVVLRFADTKPPILAEGSVVPKLVGPNNNISLSAVSDDYSANNATANIYNTTNASVARLNMSYVNNIASGYINRTTFYALFETSILSNGVFFANVSLTDRPGNQANYSLGNFTIASSTNTALYSNSSLSVNTKMEINLSAELNISLNISLSSSTGIDAFAVAYYNSNPSNANDNAVTINKFSEISVGGLLNSTLNWVEMRIFYGSSDIPPGYSENNLRIYYNHPNGSWVLFSGAGAGGVNTTEKYVWANSTHFSIYGVFVMPTCSDNIQNQGEAGVDCGGSCVACASQPPSSGGSSGGGSTATTTTATTTTTTTTATTTTTMFNVSIPPNENFLIINETAKNGSSVENKPEDNKGLPALTPVVLMAAILLAAVLKNRKNFKKLLSGLLDNLKLD